MKDLYDFHHIDNLYRVCCFCFNRIPSKVLPKESIRKPLTQLVVERAEKYYQLNFKLELSDMTMPKVLCCGCRTRLANLDTGKLALCKFENDRQTLEILPSIEDQQYSIRNKVGSKVHNCCHVCQINGSSLNNFIVKLKPLVREPADIWNSHLLR